MGKKNNRTCIICGNEYHYCPICGEDSSKPTWYFIFDSENCHDIYDVCVSYRDKVINIKEAYEKITKLDISNLENFAEPTKIQIKEIMGYKEDKNIEVENNNDLPKTGCTKNKYKK